jgi:hypothetical protein
MLAVVAVVEGLVAGRAIELTTPGTWSWRLSERAARHEATACDVLCLGDSLMKQGLLPPVVVARTGRPIYNLSVVAAQPPAAYYLLRHALDAGARPGAILVDFSPDLLAGGPEYSLRNWPEILSWAEAIEMSTLAARPRLFLDLALRRFLPSYHARFEIRDAVLKAFRGARSTNPEHNRLYTRQWARNRGGQFTPPDPRFRGQVDEGEQAKLLSGQFWCDRLNRIYVERLLNLAARHGTRVYWLRTPLAPAIQARRDRSGADAREAELILALQQTHPGLVVLDARHSGYDWPAFLDPIHLNGPGALAFSSDVADVLARGAPASSWITLPFYRERPRDLPIEDVEQSLLAIRREAAAIR